MITFGSLFSGCGLLDLSMEQAGLRCLWQCEMDPDARRVLRHHWSTLPCHEDVRQVGRGNLAAVDVIAGGFPCQDLSVAGKRAGIQKGERSGLWWEMLRVIGEIQPRVVLWENVPGLLSSDSGRDFRRVCSSLAEHGYFGCVRTLDARYFGVPQRRRRLFGVFVRDDPTAGCAAQILALADSRSGHPPTRRQERATVARTLRSRSANAGVNRPGRGGEDDENLIVNALDAHMGMGGVDDNAAQAGHIVTSPIPIQEINARTGKSSTEPRHGVANGNAGDPMFSLQASHQHGVAVPTVAAAQSGGNQHFDHAGDENSLVVSIDMRQTSRGETMTNNRGEDVSSGGAPGTGIGEDGDPCPSLAASHVPAVGFTLSSDPNNWVDDGMPPRERRHGDPGNIQHGMTVRRLTPTECLRLMGAPDDFLDLDPPLSDSVKYRLCGNGVVVPVARWLGKRIKQARLPRRKK